MCSGSHLFKVLFCHPHLALFLCFWCTVCIFSLWSSQINHLVFSEAPGQLSSATCWVELYVKTLSSEDFSSTLTCSECFSYCHRNLVLKKKRSSIYFSKPATKVHMHELAYMHVTTRGIWSWMKMFVSLAASTVKISTFIQQAQLGTVLRTCKCKSQVSEVRGYRRIDDAVEVQSQKKLSDCCKDMWLFNRFKMSFNSHVYVCFSLGSLNVKIVDGRCTRYASYTTRSFGHLGKKLIPTFPSLT